MNPAIGLAPTTAAGPPAPGPINDAAAPAELVVAADLTAAAPFTPDSRRLTANAAHANGAAPGTPPSEPAPNHDNNTDPNPDTPPEAAAAFGAAVNTGTDAAGATAITRTDPPTPRVRAGADAADAAGATARPTPAAAGSATTGAAGVVLDGGEDVPVAAEGAAAGDAERAPRCGAATEVSPPSAVMSVEPCPTRDVDADAGAEALGEGAVLGPPRVPEGVEPAAVAVRVPPRVVGPDELFALEPDDPAEPVVSANATAGMAATAAPTPNATANAPTRPTNRDDPDPITPGTPRPGSSIPRTRPAPRRQPATSPPRSHPTGGIGWAG